MSEDDTRLYVETMHERRVEELRRRAARRGRSRERYYRTLYRDMSAMVLGHELLPDIREAARRDGVYLECSDAHAISE